MIVESVAAGSLRQNEYDIGIWAAGYEERARWFVTSTFRPDDVRRWYKLLFAENHEVHSAPSNRRLEIGEVFGGEQMSVHADGEWHKAWKRLLLQEAERLGRGLRVIVDYSAMPRTVYGPLVLLACGPMREAVEEIYMVYVRGQHPPEREGSKILRGLRSMVRLDALQDRVDRPPAFIFCLGYDGSIVAAMIELYQIGKYACFYADPGVQTESVARTCESNAAALRRADFVRVAAAWDVGGSMHEMNRMVDWYGAGYNVVLVPMGPKPQVLAAILLKASRDDLSVRWAEVEKETPIQVTVPQDSYPYVTRVRWKEKLKVE